MMQPKEYPVLITTESVADLPKQLLEQYHIASIPYMLRTEHGLFQDGFEVDTRGCLSLLEDKDALVETEVPSVEEYKAFFAKQSEKADNIIHLTISGKVNESGAVSAQKAAEEFDNVTVIDSGHISTGQGLMVLKAARMAKDGAAPEEIVRKMAQMKGRICINFLLESFDDLAKHKQASKYITRFVNAMMIRPMLKMMYGKPRISAVYFGGRKRAWEKYIAFVFRKQGQIDKSLLCITYVGIATKELEEIKRMVEKKVRFEEVYCQMASPVVAANFGPGTLCMSYYKKE